MGLPDPPEFGASALRDECFAGQAVIVTGGGTGLGKAIAVEFARLGAAVGILSRAEEHRAAGVAAVEKALAAVMTRTSSMPATEPVMRSTAAGPTEPDTMTPTSMRPEP